MYKQMQTKWKRDQHLKNLNISSRETFKRDPVGYKFLIRWRLEDWAHLTIDERISLRGRMIRR